MLFVNLSFVSKIIDTIIKGNNTKFNTIKLIHSKKNTD
jgi:hypothetical protein